MLFVFVGETGLIIVNVQLLLNPLDFIRLPNVHIFNSNGIAINALKVFYDFFKGSLANTNNFTRSKSSL